MYICPAGAELCLADGRTDGRMDMKQKFTFRSVAYPPEYDSRATICHLYVWTCRSFRNLVITASMNCFIFRPFYLSRHWTHTGLTSVTQLPDIAGLCNCMLALHSFVLCAEFHVSVALVARRVCDACGVFSSQRANNCVFVCADSYRRIGESKDGYLCVRVLCACVRVCVF